MLVYKQWEKKFNKYTKSSWKYEGWFLFGLLPIYIRKLGMNNMKCKKCDGETKESKALLNSLVGVDDFGNDAGGIGTTLTRTGPANMVDCLKCSSCGHSFIPIQSSRIIKVVQKQKENKLI